MVMVYQYAEAPPYSLDQQCPTSQIKCVQGFAGNQDCSLKCEVQLAMGVKVD